MKKQNIKELIFIILFLEIVPFFLWSKLILISIVLVLIADSITTQYLPNLLKRKIPEIAFSILKYSYYILLPITFAIFIRTFFFDIYFVPSSSMERTLFPNDYVLVNKISYGTKVPKRIQDIPIVGEGFKKEGALLNYNLYEPLKSFQNFKREDIVVFKSIEDNTKFLIKRIIGMPSDTLKIENSHVFINYKKLKEKELYCYNYSNTSKRIKLVKTYSNKEFQSLDMDLKECLLKHILVKPKSFSFLFPHSFAKENNWTRDNYGELIIPKKGMSIVLNKDNIDFYKDIIRNHEKQDFEMLDNETKIYTFKNNYYFMMGDNRHGSNDSRSFGFIPESYIQGKMIKVFSKDRLFN